MVIMFRFKDVYLIHSIVQGCFIDFSSNVFAPTLMVF